MKIGIPTMGHNGLNEEVGQHFGRVPTYTIFDTQNSEITVIENTGEHMGGMGYPSELLAKKGIDVLLCKGLGRKAVQIFENMGIRVYVGARGSVSDTIDLWKAGELEEATIDNACAGHKH
ncbi:MAG: NifB/NifX family molybdenum-iron cluster-binding protein [Candidatus Methanofastidiosia archaeon]